MRSKGHAGVNVGVAVGSGSRYKVTARCVPEVSITSPTAAGTGASAQAIQPKHFALLRSRSQPSPPTSNSLFSTPPGGATLVEEEDFSLASGSGSGSGTGSAKNVLQRQLATTIQQEDLAEENLSGQQTQQQGEPPNELTPLVEEPGGFAPTTTSSAINNRYSHNSKTTRSWPVIYRNPHACDYETLYVQQQQLQQQQQSFKQNCYSNQFKQSIVYSSSNEELPGGEPVASSSADNRQTTCYYFAPSQHNSIYEHPSSVVGGSLQFDHPTTTAAAAAAVESLRRSNSILLRQNSCAKVIQRRGSGSGSPTSLGSQMEGLGMGGGVTGSACCSTCCMGPPPVLFLFVTLLMTTSATAMLCAAIMTDHWEHVTWDRNSLDRYTNRSGLHLEWLLDDQVAMLKPDKRGKFDIEHGWTPHPILVILYSSADHRFRRDSVFLVPMHGGIWTLCIDLPMQQLQELRRNPKFPRGAPPCVNYLAGSMENARGEEQRNDWQHSESQVTLQPHLSTYPGAILPRTSTLCPIHFHAILSL
ncbi:hypothetical protein KR026_008986 [Drosophila bipectinata]|nr:hypothetical protein KR026_008986 [Drosophila bipectinata]